MSDAIPSQTALDPDRPWITDEAELPARMNWFDTFFNPAGKSPKLHFTRAWTFLFFTGVFVWLGLGAIFGIVGIAGADTEVLSAFHSYLIAGVLAVSSILSYVIHTRRLNHAGKISLRAIVVLLPLMLASAMFFMGMTGKAAEYQELYEARAEFLEDPAAWREARLVEQREAQEKQRQQREEAERAAAEAAEAGEEVEANQSRGGGGRPEGNWNQGPSAENELPSKEAFIVRPNLGAFSMIIVGFNALIMIWSLLWVARVPNFGREPEPETMITQPAGPFG